MSTDKDGFELQIPESLSDEERQAYVQGLMDMAEYMQHVGYRAQQIYETELLQEPQVENPCPDCGEEQIYDGSTGLRCPECDL